MATLFRRPVPALTPALATSHSMYSAGIASMPIAPLPLGPPGVATIAPHGPIDGMQNLMRVLTGHSAAPGATYNPSGAPAPSGYSDYSYGNNPDIDSDYGFDDSDQDGDFDDSLDDSFEEETLGAALKGHGHAVAQAILAKGKAAIAKAKAVRNAGSKVIKKVATIRGWNDETCGDATSDAMSHIDSQMQSLQSQLAQLQAQDANLQAVATQYQNLAQQGASGQAGWSNVQQRMFEVLTQQYTDTDANVQQQAVNVSANIDSLNTTVDTLTQALQNLATQQQTYADAASQVAQLQQQTAVGPAYTAPVITAPSAPQPLLPQPSYSGPQYATQDTSYATYVPDAFADEDEAEFADVMDEMSD